MGDPARKIDLDPALSDPAALARGDAMMKQLRGMGLTDAEILDADTPTDATHEEVMAWLKGEAPCPWPR